MLHQVTSSAKGQTDRRTTDFDSLIVSRVSLTPRAGSPTSFLLSLSHFLNFALTNKLSDNHAEEKEETRAGSRPTLPIHRPSLTSQGSHHSFVYSPTRLHLREKMSRAPYGQTSTTIWGPFTVTESQASTNGLEVSAHTLPKASRLLPLGNSSCRLGG